MRVMKNAMMIVMMNAIVKVFLVNCVDVVCNTEPLNPIIPIIFKSNENLDNNF
jgi:hypothetical protein